VSTDEQVKHGLNLEEDRRLIEVMAAERGWSLADVYDDGGRQGDDAERPGLLAMLASVDTFDVLIIRSQDRLTRDPGIWSMITAAFKGAGVRVETFTGQVIDLESPQGELVGNIFAALGKFEKQLIGQRVKQSKGARARAGGHSGGRRPYGYEFGETGEKGAGGKPIRELRPHSTEAAVVRQMFEWADAGVSQRQIAQRLDRAGLPTSRGARWQQGQVSHILKNPLYKGLIRHARNNGEWTLYEGKHEPIIDADLFDRVNASRKMRASKLAYAGAGGRPVRGQHLLRGGMLRCGKCGGGMIPQTRPEKPDVQTYVCTTRRNHGPDACSQRSVPRAVVDEALLRELTGRYLDLDATRSRLAARQDADLAAARQAAERAEREQALAEAALARVKRDYVGGEITAAEWREIRADLDESLAAAHAAVEQARARVQTVQDTRATTDAEEAMLAHLADLKATVAGSLDRAPDLAALRTLIGQVIERVDLASRTHPWPLTVEGEGPLDTGPDVRVNEDGVPVDADGEPLPPSPGPPADYWLWITVRSEAWDAAANKPKAITLDVPEPKPTHSRCRRS